MAGSMAEAGRIMLDNLNLNDNDDGQSKKRLTKRQMSAGTYEANTPGVYEAKLQKVNFLGARKPGVVPNMWSAEEDESLRVAVRKHGETSWRVIAKDIPGRNHLQCLGRPIRNLVDEEGPLLPDKSSALQLASSKTREAEFRIVRLISELSWPKMISESGFQNDKKTVVLCTT